MQTKPYSKVISGVEALVGATLETAETLRMASIINSRARRAYEAFDLWPRWLVIGEARHVNGDKVAISELPSANNYGNLAITEIDTFIRTHKADPWDVSAVAEYDFNTVPDGARLVNYTSVWESRSLTALEYNTSGFLFSAAETPWSVGDPVKVSGVPFTSPEPDPNGEFTISAIVDAPSDNFYQSDTLPTGSGTYTLDSDSELYHAVVYATFKKRLAVTYGDGVVDPTDTTDIPLEWFEYIVRGTYADFLRSEGQTEKAIAEDNEANKLLSEQIERADNSQSHPALGTRFQTHNSSQAR